jgi:hypothetical protein
MKNKILGIALCTAGMLAVSSCSDYLETSSPSTVTASLATSSIDGCQTTLDGAYTNFHVALRDQVFGNNLFYAMDAAGSDIERHGGEQATGRLKIETFYNGGAQDVVSTFTTLTDMNISDDKTAYALLYGIIPTMNLLTDGITEEMLADEKDGKAFGEIYGQAVCMRTTCYRELIKYYGDVFSVFSLQDEPKAFSSRLDIYDKVLEDLDKAKDLCPELTATNKNKFTKQYAYALLGRIAMEAAGYQTYRLDVTDASRLERHPDYTDAHNAAYARPTNYKAYYDIAYNAFKWVAENPGGATFDAANYATFFNELHDVDGKFAGESIFEDENVQGSSTTGNCERPYAIGRPATSSNKFGVCKSYGQCRINPAFYYGKFDPRDIRRDISCVITGSYLKAGTAGIRDDLKEAGYDGKGCCYEVILGFNMKTAADGAGIACGKFDENRQVSPYITKQRMSGINAPYMRISEVYLGLAEAALMKTNPDLATATNYYNMLHVRAGLPAANGVTLEEIVDERGFEFAAEGDRRWTLIRTGLIGKKVKEMKELTKKMIDGLKANGYYTFDNGNTIGNYIYYKGVDPTALGMSSRLTNPTPAAMRVAGYEPATDLEAVQFPGWRGQHDWEQYKTYKDGKFPNSNIAIKGLFTNITTTPEGYYQKPWGKAIVDQEATNGFYYEDFFKGWDFKSAPIYLVPLSENALIGGYKNGYDFTSF